MPTHATSFSECREQDVLVVVTADGETISGSYLTQARMHFLSIKNAESLLLDKVVGPFNDEDVSSIEIVKDRDTILDERHRRLRGDRHPGREPVTREDFEYRLETLAKAHAAAEGKRRDQLRRQFDDVADRIHLARAKRQWIIASGFWFQKSNRPPDLADLWQADIASPSLMARPRPQDFDPDPVERRRKTKLPEEALADPRSVPNVIRAMKAAGMKAIISLAGDPTWERAVVQIDLGPGRTMRWNANAHRNAARTIEWKLGWGGNESRPGLRKREQSFRLDSYKQLRQIIERANRGEIPRSGDNA
jgi:hypothetical protein